MEIKIFEVSSLGFQEVEYDLFAASKQNTSSIYIIDIQAKERASASNELEKLGISAEISQKTLTPADNIRFEYIEETLYGEVTYFSSKIKEAHYAGIIVQNNCLIGIHQGSESLFSNLAKSFASFKEEQRKNISIDLLLYSFIIEFLSKYGKLILAYREEVEVMASELDGIKTSITPEDIWKAKLQATTFLQALDKLNYTLSFPPTKEILESESPYLKSFEYLLKNLALLKSSLSQLEKRLDSLNDHYHLILQSKSNKRLNILTIIQAIFVPLTLIAGIYGMNFVNMPGLNLTYGYHFSLILMVGVSVISLSYFYKNGWFN